ncbi:MAG: glycoside hydrolase family 57 protein [Rikenellaceae bacterium]
MKNVCLFFQIHHPLKLKKYRFFNMGNDTFYLDEFLNKSAIVKSAAQCYDVANQILLDQISKLGKQFKVSFSISGTAIEQIKKYSPKTIESFKALAQTGCVDFIAETYSHSLASLVNKEEFKKQIERQAELVEECFGVKPTAFRNTELIYTSGIGEMVSEFGYDTIITEGARHILGWKSPNYVYANSLEPKVKLLIRNSSLCDDLRYRFSDQTWDQWPLSTSTYAEWAATGEGEVTNIFLDYETFGIHNNAESGIFDFLATLPEAMLSKGIEFKFASEVTKELQPISALDVVHPISWADEERDTTPWLGNELQREAYNQLYSVRESVERLNDENLNYVWDFLQCSNHFYFMSTKWFSGGSIANKNPYDSPYEAFINYMNVASDFIRQVREKIAILDKA